MLQNILNLEGVTVLNKKQQGSISGGANFECYCGHVGGQFEHLKFYVEADNVTEALNSINCGGYGATCSGD
ncbi:MAG TPA: hypothetical protein VLZ83_06255 [Edaphocola sp.]|nr:hypothetical protein [Edaphocola sp.]